MATARITTMAGNNIYQQEDVIVPTEGRRIERDNFAGGSLFDTPIMEQNPDARHDFMDAAQYATQHYVNTRPHFSFDNVYTSSQVINAVIEYITHNKLNPAHIQELKDAKNSNVDILQLIKDLK